MKRTGGGRHAGEEIAGVMRVIGAEQEIGNAFFQRGQPQHQSIMDGGKNSK